MTEKIREMLDAISASYTEPEMADSSIVTATSMSEHSRNTATSPIK